MTSLMGMQASEHAHFEIASSIDTFSIDSTNEPKENARMRAALTSSRRDLNSA
jgi:hypothetical protein